ncbi:DDE_3 domain-containing protein [Trichonephila clavipes]|nr:DDE_3 domain-containing protein [Trichonephila clavipes]
MDDNVKPHRALLVDELLESDDTCRLDWPARYPDFNPIEHIWDDVGKGNSQPILRTLQEMKTVLLNEWGQLPQELINSFISSMTSRYEAWDQPTLDLLGLVSSNQRVNFQWVLSHVGINGDEKFRAGYWVRPTGSLAFSE